MNYQKELDELLKKIKELPHKPSLLLHACCGPCSSYVLEYLAEFFKITVFYYNPNIYPKEEFERRLGELKNLYKKFPPALKNDVQVVEWNYNPEDFYEAVGTRENPELAKEPEKGERCRRCYELRLKKAFEYAKTKHFDYFCTTLSISPFKDAEKINVIGLNLMKAEVSADKEEVFPTGVKKSSDNEKSTPSWLPSDFKKKGGFKRSLEISAEYGMYRQDYCGCVYSMQKNKKLITIKNCRIEDSKNTLIPQVNWNFYDGEAWLVTGTNGSGKADFLNALGGLLKITPNRVENGGNQNSSGRQNSGGKQNSSGELNFTDGNVDSACGFYENSFGESVEIVSLERAAKLIEEERLNDESEFTEGGVDIGRTGRVFIAEALCGKIRKNEPLPEIAKKIEAFPAIKLCGVEYILDRGLKYMSTGEIRRTLLARALISKKKLLILSDPFAGLDVQSRKILLDFFTTVTQKQKEKNAGSEYPRLILAMERWHEIPSSITNVLEFSDKKISFCGKRNDYESILKKREQENSIKNQTEKNEFSKAVAATLEENKILKSSEEENAGLENNPKKNTAPALVEMNHVNVGWDNHKVLVDLSWKLNKGEHWLIQGPNGSGKTTFLELITGDCMQVYANDVRLFGRKRGSGETIWEIKKQLGIVSYRLHVEYRMLGSTPLLNVIISGFKDSIGLYEAPKDTEIPAAKKWLEIAGFGGRENENFGNLSYGEQRAILILRSAVKSPKILILDEPCHGLDEKTRTKILSLMETIAKSGSTTMLHVTHDSSEILSCEKHILELHPGENPMYRILER